MTHSGGTNWWSDVDRRQSTSKTGGFPPPSAEATQKRLSVRHVEANGRPARTTTPSRRRGAPPPLPPPSLPFSSTSGRPAGTAKGAAIRREMRALGDDYFGGVESRAPAGAGGAAALPSPSAAAFRRERGAAPTAVPPGWRTGPRDPAGRVLDVSDRNLLCADVLLPAGGGEGAPLAVFGSADHGLAVFDLRSGAPRRRLYGARGGHTEWVTTCRFVPGAGDGRVLSGGMDGKLCLWEDVRGGGGKGGGARCRDLLGHTGSISQVDVNAAGRALSASYDRTLRVWDCNDGGELGRLAGHTAAVLLFDWCGTSVLSGDRGGVVKIWDLPTATCRATVAMPRGQIGSLAYLVEETTTTEGGGEGRLLALIGDQGGELTVLDTRQGERPAHAAVLHPGGVLSGIRPMPGTPYVATCGADKRVLVLDARQGFTPVHELRNHTNFIYSLEVFGSMVLSGAGNGWLLVHDALTGDCCYGLGANTAAVRVIFASPTLMVAGGDDGKATVYDY